MLNLIHAAFLGFGLSVFGYGITSATDISSFASSALDGRGRALHRTFTARL